MTAEEVFFHTEKQTLFLCLKNNYTKSLMEENNSPSETSYYDIAVKSTVKEAHEALGMI